MYTRWTQHLSDEEEKERFRETIISARFVLGRLKSMLEEDEQSLERSEQDQRIYDLPNWDYRQAHKNGVRQAYSQIKKMIDLDQQKGSLSDRRELNVSSGRQ